MSDITVLTSITAGKDHLREDQLTEGGNFIAYVSQPRRSALWEERQACNFFRSDRRNSRPPKILSHHFCDSEYSIWIDGNIGLRASPTRLVNEYLDQSDIAVFKHPVRNCIYQEARVCAENGLDSAEVLTRQTTKYRSEGYPENHGLAECNVIVRRHTSAIVEFNNAWWSEYCCQSVRDQISFMYVAANLNLRIRWIEPAASAGRHEFFHYSRHLTPQAEPAL